MAAQHSGGWRDVELHMHFDAITALLRAHQQFWRPQAFTVLRLPWESAYPELAKALRALSLTQAEHYAVSDRALAEFLQPYLIDTKTLSACCAVPAITACDSPQIAREPYGVPGRKLQQIRAFIADFPIDKTPVLEWCAGKAHLGRDIARQSGCTVTALEWNAELVAAGDRLSQREQLPVRMQHVDVLDSAAANFIEREQRVVALHACGDLHLQLLRGCAERQPQSVLLAPCCYQLIAADTYRPLSQHALANDLELSKLDLHTAVQGSVTSPVRVQRQRKQLQSWRLGFDLLQREWRGIDEYLPTPSLPFSVLNGSFAEFCSDLALRYRIERPLIVDFARYEAAGTERLREVTALDLPRILFRRALELWLALDRALFLQEHGYAVEIGEFCARALTPRNVMIRAHRRD